MAGSPGDELAPGTLGSIWNLEPEAVPHMTYEEFLAWADEDTLAEWVAGEVVMTSPASADHQDLGGFLLATLRVFVEHHGLGWVGGAPFQMKTGPDLPGREPDILFVSTAHLDRLRPNHLAGPADLAIEIVSPESVGRDRGEKFYEYAQGGVPEYWVIEPQSRWAEFYRLEGTHYRPAFSGAEGEYRSDALPGFRLRVEGLWQRPLPKVVDALRDLGVL